MLCAAKIHPLFQNPIIERSDFAFGFLHRMTFAATKIPSKHREQQCPVAPDCFLQSIRQAIHIFIINIAVQVVCTIHQSRNVGSNIQNVALTDTKFV